MTAPGNEILLFMLTLGVIMSSGYAVGRIHQWHRHGVERDEAYRIGYDKASRSIISMMSDQKAVDAASGTRIGRHAAPTGPRRGADTSGNRAPVNQRQSYPINRG